MLDLYNDMYEDISYYNISDLNQDNLVKKEKTILEDTEKKYKMIALEQVSKK